MRWIRTLLKSLAAEGRTVLLSSHLMSEMAITADRLIIIGRGRLLAETTVADLVAGGSGGFVRVRSPQSAPLATLLESHGASVERQPDGVLHVSGVGAGTIGEIATANALVLQELSTQHPTLEETYMELTRDAVDYHTADGAVVKAS